MHDMLWWEGLCCCSDSQAACYACTLPSCVHTQIISDLEDVLSRPIIARATPVIVDVSTNTSHAHCLVLPDHHFPLTVGTQDVCQGHPPECHGGGHSDGAG